MTLIVGLDAGHGGPDSGATAVDWAWTEAEYNMGLARMLLSFLKTPGLNVEPVLLRTGDSSNPSLEERGKLSRELGCGLVLNLHVNANKSQWAHGGEAYYWPGNDVGRSVARIIARSLPNPLATWRPRAIKAVDRPEPRHKWLQKPRAVMAPHACTSVLIEVGMISNVNDRLALSQEEVKWGLVLACAAGVVDFQRLRAA